MSDIAIVSHNNSKRFVIAMNDVDRGPIYITRKVSKMYIEDVKDILPEELHCYELFSLHEGNIICHAYGDKQAKIYTAEGKCYPYIENWTDIVGLASVDAELVAKALIFGLKDCAFKSNADGTISNYVAINVVEPKNASIWNWETRAWA